MAADLRIWAQLPADLQDRIISFLDPNEVACTVRVVCKPAAARYSGPQHTRIRLSQRVPSHAFAQRWACPEAMRILCHEQKRQLLCLIAASGSIPNLQLLLPLVGCALQSDMLSAAAAAGQSTICRWLRQQGCPWDESAMEAAGRSGSRALCDWLIAGDCPGGAASALVGAASAGHVGLVDQLLASYGPAEDPAEVLVAAAGGCDLPTLRRLHAAFMTDEGEQPDPAQPVANALVKAAAGSSSPDWREKLEWLATEGFPRSEYASVQAARCPDALDRLTWLAGRGWPMHPGHVARRAAQRGNVDALRFALDTHGRQGGSEAQAEVRRMESHVVDVAATNGQLAALQYLHAFGCSMEPASGSAASHGHLHVVAWLMETLGAGAVLGEEVFKAAACSGSLPLLVWLRERGCVCRDEGVLDAALAKGCSEEVLEWLLAQGCSLQLSTSGFWAPAERGDLATLAWLRRMGCPWAEDGSTFTGAVAIRSPLPSLRWLAEAGCPVDWAGALEMARFWWSDLEVAELEELHRQCTAQ